MKRQWDVLEKPEPPHIHALIEESALCRIVGNPQIQYEQLSHLLRLATLPQITVQILPLSKGVAWGMYGQYDLDIFIFEPPRPPVLFVEEYDDHHKSESTFETNKYRTLYTTLCERALTPAQSIEFIRTVANNLQR
jgi:hypothetical protein